MLNNAEKAKSRDLKKSDPAHVVISFGKCHIELYRHRDGSLCGVGPLLIQLSMVQMICLLKSR